MINNLIPSRNDILSLQTESYESIQNYNTNNYKKSMSEKDKLLTEITISL